MRAVVALFWPYSASQKVVNGCTKSWVSTFVAELFSFCAPRKGQCQGVCRIDVVKTLLGPQSSARGPPLAFLSDCNLRDLTLAKGRMEAQVGFLQERASRPLRGPDRLVGKGPGERLLVVC